MSESNQRAAALVECSIGFGSDIVNELVTDDGFITRNKINDIAERVIEILAEKLNIIWKERVSPDEIKNLCMEDIIHMVEQAAKYLRYRPIGKTAYTIKETLNDIQDIKNADVNKASEFLLFVKDTGTVVNSVIQKRLIDESALKQKEQLYFDSSKQAFVYKDIILIPENEKQITDEIFAKISKTFPSYVESILMNAKEKAENNWELIPEYKSELQKIKISVTFWSSYIKIIKG